MDGTEPPQLPFALRPGRTWEPWMGACLASLARAATPALLVDAPPEVAARLGGLPVAASDDPDTAGHLHGLAFVLDFSDAEPPPALAGATPHGWWYLRDADGHPPGHIGLGALLAGRRFVDVHLLRRAPGGMAETLEEGALRVVIVSPEATRERILNGSADWPMHHACRLAAGGTLAPRPAPVLPPSRPAPGWQVRLARYRNTLRRAVELSRDEAWTGGVIDAPAASLVGALARAGVAAGRGRGLPSLPGGFVADSMALPDGEAPAYCLAEGYRFGEDKGFLL